MTCQTSSQQEHIKPDTDINTSSSTIPLNSSTHAQQLNLHKHKHYPCLHFKNHSALLPSLTLRTSTSSSFTFNFQFHISNWCSPSTQRSTSSTNISSISSISSEALTTTTFNLRPLHVSEAPSSSHSNHHYDPMSAGEGHSGLVSPLQKR